jgi:hypothetical protein
VHALGGLYPIFSSTATTYLRRQQQQQPLPVPVGSGSFSGQKEGLRPLSCTCAYDSFRRSRECSSPIIIPSKLLLSEHNLGTIHAMDREGGAKGARAAEEKQRCEFAAGFIGIRQVAAWVARIDLSPFCPSGWCRRFC